MANLIKTYSSLLDWYFQLGIDTFIQKKPRNRLSINDLNNLKESLNNLNNIELKKNAKNLVFSDGNPKAKIMLIGEAPGYEEDLSGIPFVGHAGKKLDQMINAIGLDRKNNTYITNIIPWRPPNNRTPTDNEINFFLPYVEEHISIIKPKILLLFGNIASKSLLRLKNGITKNHGKWFKYSNPLLKKNISTICIFHPSYLLRSPNKKKLAWEDLKKVKEKMINLRILL